MPTIIEAVRAIQPHIPFDKTSILDRSQHDQPTSGIDRIPPELLLLILSNALVSCVDWSVFAQVSCYWFTIIHSFLYTPALEEEGKYQLSRLVKKIKGLSKPETAGSIRTLEGCPIEPHARLFRPICELATHIFSRELYKGPVISAFKLVFEGADRAEVINVTNKNSFKELIKVGQIRRLFGCDAASILKEEGIPDRGNAKARIDEIYLPLVKIYFFREHASLILGLAQQKAFNFPAWLSLPERAQIQGLTKLLSDILSAPKDSPQLNNLKQMLEHMLRNRLFFISHRNTQPNSIIWLMIRMRQSVDRSEYKILLELEDWLIQFVQASAHPSLFPGIPYDQLEEDSLARALAMFNSTEETKVLALFSDAIRENHIELAEKWIACFSHSKWMRAYFYSAFLKHSIEMGKEKLVNMLYTYEPILKPKPPALPDSLEQMPAPAELPEFLESPEPPEHAQSPLESTTDQPIALQIDPSAPSEPTVHANSSKYSSSTTISHLQYSGIPHDQAENIDLQIGSIQPALPTTLPDSLEQFAASSDALESPEPLEFAQSLLKSVADRPIALQGDPSAAPGTVHASSSEYSPSTIIPHLQHSSILPDQARNIDLQLSSTHSKYSIRNVLFLGKLLSRARLSDNEDDRKRAERLKEKMHSHAPWGLGWLVKLSIAVSAGFFSFISLAFQSTSL